MLRTTEARGGRLPVCRQALRQQQKRRERRHDAPRASRRPSPSSLSLFDVRVCPVNTHAHAQPLEPRCSRATAELQPRCSRVWGGRLSGNRGGWRPYFGARVGWLVGGARLPRVDKGFASFEFLAGIAALRPPLTLISTECHPRGRTGVSDCATRARSSCSQRCNSKFTVALRRWKPPRKTGVALCRLSRVCVSAMDNSVAFVLKDCATSREGRSA